MLQDGQNVEAALEALVSRLGQRVETAVASGESPATPVAPEALRAPAAPVAPDLTSVASTSGISSAPMSAAPGAGRGSVGGNRDGSEGGS